jgi:hypothetical protein
MSGACPVCGRAFQRWFVAEVGKLADAADHGDLNSISLIFSEYRTPEDQLTASDTVKMMRSLSETIKNAIGLGWIAGGVDISLNDGRQKKQGIAWQPQIYVIAHGDMDAVRKLLRDKYSRTELVTRPVLIKRCDGTAQAISYAFKTDFIRRISYQKEVGPPERRRNC